jgi:iron complex transport system permease protein
MKERPEGFRLYEYLIFTAILLLTVLFCVCAGSVSIPVKDTLTAIWNSIFDLPIPEGISKSIILFVRPPRVICAALIGAALSLGGAAMQGLLRNPLADGSTLGVSSGASLGASLAIAFNITIPSIPFGATMFMAMIFAFLSLAIILSLAHRLDFSLSTNTIILIGVIFTMFTNSIISFIVTFAGERVKSIMFWTMGSLSGSSYANSLILLVALIVFGTAITLCSRELNAFAIGEENARHVGVNVKRVKLIILISVSALIGVCVSIGGTIGFVGLVIPHMTRMLTGPNHKRLLPATLFSGAIFLMLTDLLGRVIINPLQLPIGVVTSFIGSIVFVYIFYSTRKVS